MKTKPVSKKNKSNKKKVKKDLEWLCSRYPPGAVIGMARVFSGDAKTKWHQAKLSKIIKEVKYNDVKYGPYPSETATERPVVDEKVGTRKHEELVVKVKPVYYCPDIANQVLEKILGANITSKPAGFVPNTTERKDRQGYPREFNSVFAENIRVWDTEYEEAEAFFEQGEFWIHFYLKKRVTPEDFKKHADRSLEIHLNMLDDVPEQSFNVSVCQNGLRASGL